MASLFELTSMFLVTDGWPVMRVEDTNTLHMSYQGENGIFVCLATILEESRTILFYSLYPVEFTPEQYGEALEFVARANDGLINGCFEFDFTDGEVKYRTSLTLPDIDPTHACIRQLVYDAATAMDLYLPGLNSLTAGELSAVDAIDMVEQHIDRTDS